MSKPRFIPFESVWFRAGWVLQHPSGSFDFLCYKFSFENLSYSSQALWRDTDLLCDFLCAAAPDYSRGLVLKQPDHNFVLICDIVAVTPTYTHRGFLPKQRSRAFVLAPIMKPALQMPVPFNSHQPESPLSHACNTGNEQFQKRPHQVNYHPDA